MRSIDGVLFQPASTAPEFSTPRIPAPEFVEGPLVGRQEDWQAALQGISQGKKIYLYGGYGIGKTRLASELFNYFAKSGDFPGGYLWVTAAGMDSARVLEEIALNLQALQVQKTNDVPAKIGVLQRALSGRGEILIGVDDVVDPAVARDLLAATANCPLILNGSRSGVLGGLGYLLELKPLAPADASRLFLQESGELDRELDAGSRKLILQICEALEYNPLGIRLAARKHADGESLSHLVELLQLKPDLWIEEDQSLGAAFMASYQDIQNRPQSLQLWLILASFPAFEAPEQDLRELLPGFNRQDYQDARYELQKLGLIDVERERLVLHPLIGRGLRLVERDELKKVQELTFNWLVRFAVEHREDYTELERQRENLLGLLDWYSGEGQWEQVVGLLRSLFHYFRVRGLWQLAYDHLEGIVEHASQLVEPFNHAWALLHRGILRTLRSELDLASGDLDEAGRLFAGQDNQVYQGKALYRKAAVSHGRGDLALAARQLRKALKWMGDQVPHDRAGAHERLGGILAAQGKLKQARQQYNKALALDDPEVNARTHMALGELDRLAGRLGKASENFQRARQIAEGLGHSLQRADVELQIAYLHYYQGRYVETLAALRVAQEIYEQLGFLNGLAQVQHARGNLAFAQGELEEATRFYQAALESNLDTGLDLNAAYNRYQLAVLAHRRGRLDEARSMYEQLMVDALRMSDTVLQSAVMLQQGSLAYEQGHISQSIAQVQQVFELSQQIEDRFVQSAALYYKGLIQAQEGYSEDARQSLSLAHAGFAAIGSVDATKVESVLQVLEQAGSGKVQGQGYIQPVSIVPPPGMSYSGMGEIPPEPIDVIVKSEYLANIRIDRVLGNLIGVDLSGFVGKGGDKPDSKGMLIARNEPRLEHAGKGKVTDALAGFGVDTTKFRF
jgi:tetratricopeptide (TPR) repeat protein